MEETARTPADRVTPGVRLWETLEHICTRPPVSYRSDVYEAALVTLDAVEAIVYQHMISGHAVGGVITDGILRKLADLRAQLAALPPLCVCLHTRAKHHHRGTGPCSGWMSGFKPCRCPQFVALPPPPTGETHDMARSSSNGAGLRDDRVHSVGDDTADQQPTVGPEARGTPVAHGNKDEDDHQAVADRARLSPAEQVIKRLHALLQDIDAVIDPEMFPNLQARIDAELLPCDELDSCPTYSASASALAPPAIVDRPASTERSYAVPGDIQQAMGHAAFPMSSDIRPPAAPISGNDCSRVLQQIMQTLGPEAVCECAGCAWETNEAIRLLNSLGIEYQPRGEKRMEHNVVAERRGNETDGVGVRRGSDDHSPDVAPGHLIVDLRYGSRHHHLEGEMGLHPQRVETILRAVYEALDQPALAGTDPETGTGVIRRLHALLQDVDAVIDPELFPDLQARIDAELMPCSDAGFCPTLTVPPPVKTGASTDDTRTHQEADGVTRREHQAPNRDRVDGGTGPTPPRDRATGARERGTQEAVVSGAQPSDWVDDQNIALAPPWPFSAEDFETRAHAHDGFRGVLRDEHDLLASMLRSAAALRREVDDNKDTMDAMVGCVDSWTARAEAAEREVARLTEELKQTRA